MEMYSTALIIFASCEAICIALLFWHAIKSGDKIQQLLSELDEYQDRANYRVTMSSERSTNERKAHVWLSVKNGYDGEWQTLRMTRGQYEEAVTRAAGNQKDNPWREQR